MGTDTDGSYIISNGPVCNKFQIVPVKSADTVFADPLDLLNILTSGQSCCLTGNRILEDLSGISGDQHMSLV